MSVHTKTSTGSSSLQVLKRVSIFLFLLVVLAIILLPFYWTVISSLKTAGGIFVYPPQWLPDRWAWENFVEVFNAAPFGRYFVNTTFYAMSVMVGQLISCSLAGVACGRVRFPGRNQLFIIYLATMMIP